MRRFIWIAAVKTGLCGAASAKADEAPLFGYWLTENNRAIVRIEPCMTNLDPKACGRIVWLAEPMDTKGRVKTDHMNPDVARRGDHLCSVELIKSFERQPNGAWTGGKIYNPQDGQNYAAEMELDGPDGLRLRGYVLLPLFGRTQRWTRVADDRGGCRATAFDGIPSGS